MLALVVVIPQLASDEDILTLHEALADRALNTLAAFLLIAIVPGAVEETVASFDGLQKASVSYLKLHRALDSLGGGLKKGKRTL